MISTDDTDCNSPRQTATAPPAATHDGAAGLMNHAHPAVQPRPTPRMPTPGTMRQTVPKPVLKGNG